MNKGTPADPLREANVDPVFAAAPPAVELWGAEGHLRWFTLRISTGPYPPWLRYAARATLNRAALATNPAEQPAPDLHAAARFLIETAPAVLALQAKPAEQPAGKAELDAEYERGRKAGITQCYDASQSGVGAVQPPAPLTDDQIRARYRVKHELRDKEETPFFGHYLDGWRDHEAVQPPAPEPHIAGTPPRAL